MKRSPNSPFGNDIQMTAEHEDRFVQRVKPEGER